MAALIEIRRAMSSGGSASPILRGVSSVSREEENAVELTRHAGERPYMVRAIHCIVMK
jgi:hypothetical protein